MDDLSHIFARLQADFSEVMAGESERRRPGITALRREIQALQPEWSDRKVAAEANKQYSCDMRKGQV